jgi:hypothetical protein
MKKIILNVPAKALLTALLLSTTGTLQALEYELHGVMHQENTPLNGQPPSTNSAAFSVFVKADGWLILTEHAQTGVPGKMIREVGTVNGREMFDMVRRDPPPRGTGPFASVSSNAVPTSRNEGNLWACHLWLILASQSFFEGRTGEEITPVYDIDAGMPQQPSLTRKAGWVLSPKTPHLPLSVVYRTPARLPASTLSRKPGAPARADSAAMLLWTDAVYTVTASASVGDLTLPTAFSFERLIGGNRRVVLCTATVTNISAVCSRKNFTPAVASDTLVEDRRPVAGQSPTSVTLYVAGPGQLHFRNGASAGVSKVTRSRAAIILCALTILSAAAIILVLRTGRHKRSSS